MLDGKEGGRSLSDAHRLQMRLELGHTSQLSQRDVEALNVKHKRGRRQVTAVSIHSSSEREQTWEIQERSAVHSRHKASLGS